MTTTLDDRDVARVVRKLPGELVEIAKTHDVVVAGGVVRAAVTGEKISDIDVFGADEAACREAAAAYKSKLPPFCSARQVDSSNAITVVARDRRTVQFITRWSYSTPEQLIRSFDFSVARAAVWWRRNGVGWASVCDPRFYVDLAARRLVYMDPVDNTAGGTLLRLQKFAARGYRASAFQVTKVVQALVGAAGGDQATNDGIAALVREVDPRAPEWEDLDQQAPAPEPPTPADDDPTF